VEAIKTITDQDILVEIAKGIKDPDESIAAVNKLTDRAKLVDIVVSAQFYGVKAAAVEKLNDQTIESVLKCENHDFQSHSRSWNRHDSEWNISWEECSLCGLWRNYKEGYRFTDY
jgi:hypothetical protein